MGGIIRKYNGRTVTQEELDRLLPPKENWLDGAPMVANTYTEHDPWISDGCGVMKSQIAEARDDIKKHNMQGVSVLPDGRVRATSRRARNEWLKHRGLHDIDGGFNDA
jgi:hypothetical protein